MEGSDTTENTAPTTDELIAQFLAEQKQHRDELAALRSQLEAHKISPPTGHQVRPQTPEELFAARMEEIAQHEFYCPGCGKLADYPQQCRGRAEAPHQPIEVISTDELKSGDPSQHTPAPATANLG